MATNLILNMHIVVVESMIEIAHAMKYQNATEIESINNGTNVLPHCENPESDIFGVSEISSEITLYLYPFGVEFVGIGGLFFYDMYNKIGHM